MNRTKFRSLCILGFLLLGFGVYATFSAEANLPPDLAAYLDRRYESDLPVVDWVLGVFALGALVSMIGMLVLARWARPLFTVCVLTTTAGMVLSGPVVQSPMETAIYEVGTVLDGVLIALMYFSEIRHEFSKTKDS